MSAYLFCLSCTSYSASASCTVHRCPCKRASYTAGPRRPSGPINTQAPWAPPSPLPCPSRHPLLFLPTGTYKTKPTQQNRPCFRLSGQGNARSHFLCMRHGSKARLALALPSRCCPTRPQECRSLPADGSRYVIVCVLGHVLHERSGLRTHAPLDHAGTMLSPAITQTKSMCQCQASKTAWCMLFSYAKPVPHDTCMGTMLSASNACHAHESHCMVTALYSALWAFGTVS